MQLGTRWSVGATPPPRLSAEMVAAITEVEAALAETDTSQWRWTLTWLEGHAVAELDDGTIVREGYDGAVLVSQPDTDADE